MNNTSEPFLENPKDQINQIKFDIKESNTDQKNLKFLNNTEILEENIDFPHLSKIFVNFIKDLNTKSKVNQVKQKTKQRKQKIEKKVINKIDYKKETNSLNKSSPKNPNVHSPSSVNYQLATNFLNQALQNDNVNGSQNPNVNEVIQHLQYCFANNLLTVEQISQIDKWIENQIVLRDQQELTHPEPLDNERKFPTNCMHIKICYFIWDQKNTAIIDPTEYGRQYKESIDQSQNNKTSPPVNNTKSTD